MAMPCFHRIRLARCFAIVVVVVCLFLNIVVVVVIFVVVIVVVHPEQQCVHERYLLTAGS